MAGGTPLRLGVFGGSFDPPHVGHQLLLLHVLETEPVDRIVLVPAVMHALGKELSPFAERVAMCRRMVAALGSRVEISEVEARLPAPKGRTLETLQALKAERPGASLRLIVGADILGETDRWYRWSDVAALAPPIVVGRQGFGGAGPDARSAAGAAARVQIPAVASRDVRARLARGESVAHLLPATVLAYIQDRGLYGVRS